MVWNDTLRLCVLFVVAARPFSVERLTLLAKCPTAVWCPEFRRVSAIGNIEPHSKPAASLWERRILNQPHSDEASFGTILTLGKPHSEPAELRKPHSKPSSLLESRIMTKPRSGEASFATRPILSKHHSEPALLWGNLIQNQCCSEEFSFRTSLSGEASFATRLILRKHHSQPALLWESPI